VGAVVCVDVVVGTAVVGGGVGETGIAEVCADGVAAETPKAVSADEAKYEPDPAKLAVIVYGPGTGGVHISLYIPLMSVVVVPMTYVLLLGSDTLRVTGTPVAFVGLGCCSYR